MSRILIQIMKAGARVLTPLFVVAAVAHGADTVAPMITDPPVLVTNQTAEPIYVQYYAEMAAFPHIVKSGQRVPAGAQNFRAHGLFVYAQEGFASGMRDQDNKITIQVYTDAQPRELLAMTVFHKELWDAQDIEKDEFETLYIVFGEDHTLDARLEDPTGL